MSHEPAALTGPHAPEWESRTQPTGGGDASLDSNCDSPTAVSTEESRADSVDDESADSEDSLNWNRQQSRTFHRVASMLYYWEVNGYEVKWITLTSSPESPDADRLAYNHQRLRQCVERADLAYDERTDDYRRMSHINELEQVTIRTNEGPEGKGVIHTFWAWKPPEGQHSREFYIPQSWLSGHWDRLHDATFVWIEDYGVEDHHDRQHVARYCASQYVGEHGEALEHVSWSWSRSLGGPMAETWKSLKAHVSGLQEALSLWHRLLAGETVTLSRRTGTTEFKPPPNLGRETRVGINPPPDYRSPGPEGSVRRESFTSDDDDDQEALSACSGCGRYKPRSTVHTVGYKDGRRVRVCSDCRN